MHSHSFLALKFLSRSLLWVWKDDTFSLRSHICSSLYLHEDSLWDLNPHNFLNCLYLSFSALLNSICCIPIVAGKMCLLQVWTLSHKLVERACLFSQIVTITWNIMDFKKITKSILKIYSISRQCADQIKVLFHWNQESLCIRTE